MAVVQDTGAEPQARAHRGGGAPRASPEQPKAALCIPAEGGEARAGRRVSGADRPPGGGAGWEGRTPLQVRLGTRPEQAHEENDGLGRFIVSF